MTVARVRRPHLLVFADDPAHLAGWLSADAAGATLVLPRAGSLGDRHRIDGLEHWRNRAGSGWDVVLLPLDGPAGALAAAVAGLARSLGADAQRTAVLLEGAPPPPPELLRVISARSPMIPAVDLVTGAWATEGRVWLGGPGGVAELQHGIAGDGGGRGLARAVRALALLPTDSPAMRWVSQVEDATASGPMAAIWDEVLRAMYVEASVHVLAAPVGGLTS